MPYGGDQDQDRIPADAKFDQVSGRDCRRFSLVMSNAERSRWFMGRERR
jgi:hypothetical protein